MEDKGQQLRVAARSSEWTRRDADRNARFASVVMPHVDEAYSLALWLTGNRADAEDVVQDACLRAFSAIDGFSGGSARAWVLTIVRHTAYSWLGKNRKTPVLAVEDLETVESAQSSSTGPDAETPETTIIAKADAEQISAAIQALPPPYRETLILRDIEGLDYREIAKVTEVPIGTVMSRLARARHRLMAAIGRS